MRRRDRRRAGRRERRADGAAEGAGARRSQPSPLAVIQAEPGTVEPGRENGRMTTRNRDTDAARRFHNATKYAGVRDATGATDLLMGEPPDLGPALGEQDPALEPLPYKIYTSLEPIPLPRAEPAPATPALAAWRSWKRRCSPASCNWRHTRSASAPSARPRSTTR